MTKTIHGRIHGRTIEMDEALDLADGEEVEVTVRRARPRRPWGEGIRRSAGGWADYPEMDAVMEQIHQERKMERRPQLENE